MKNTEGFSENIKVKTLSVRFLCEIVVDQIAADHIFRPAVIVLGSIKQRLQENQTTLFTRRGILVLAKTTSGLSTDSESCCSY